VFATVSAAGESGAGTTPNLALSLLNYWRAIPTSAARRGHVHVAAVGIERRAMVAGECNLGGCRLDRAGGTDPCSRSSEGVAGLRIRPAHVRSARDWWGQTSTRSAHPECRRGVAGAIGLGIGLPGVGVPLLVVAALVLLSALTYIGAALLQSDVGRPRPRRASSRRFFMAAGLFLVIFAAYVVAFYADAEIAHPEYGGETAFVAIWAFGSLFGLVITGFLGLWRFIGEANEQSAAPREQ
jgi:hypothetical protein